MTTKPAYHHGDLHQALLQAGDEVLREKGFKGFTMRECARRAGVSHAAPKHHFGDATGFLTELAAKGFEQLTEYLQTEMQTTTNLHEEFAATTRAYMQFATDNPEHFRLMFRHDLLNEDAKVLWHASSETFAELSNVILRQRGEPEITGQTIRDSKSPREIRDDIVIGWCHIHGFAHLVLEQQLQMMDKEEEQKVVDRVAARLSDLIQQRVMP